MTARCRPPSISHDGQEAWAHRLGHLLWEISAQASALDETTLAATPLSLSALGVMDWIAGYPGITIAEIARRAPISRQAISRPVGCKDLASSSDG